MRRFAIVLLLPLVVLACQDLDLTDPPIVAPPAPQLDVTNTVMYVATDLGNLGGEHAQATDINNDGVIIGASNTVPGPFQNLDWRAFVVVDGSLVPLPTFPLGPAGPGRSVANEINASGVIVGHAFDAPDGICCNELPVYWESGQLREMGFPRPMGFSYGFGINDAGEMVGAISGDPFVWKDGQPTFLPLPEGITGAQARDINNHGQIVGLGWSGGERYLLRWNNLVPEVLATIGTWMSNRPAINDAGHIVGRFRTVSGDVHAFLYTEDGGMRDLGTLGGLASEAWDINERDQIVGAADDEFGNRRAFLWDPDTETMTALPELAPGRSMAHAINDAGEIVGRAEIGPGARAVLWTQGVVEPPSNGHIEEAGLAIHSFPDGDGSTGPDDHWYGLMVYLNGDYAGTDASDIHFTAAGTPVAVDRVEVLPSDEVDVRLAVWGEFEGGPAPLGLYEVSVTDAEGQPSNSFALGEVLGHPEGMTRMSYPYHDAVVLEQEPAFSWEPESIEHAGMSHAPAHYNLRLWSPDELSYFARQLPAEVSTIPFRYGGWTPSQPEALGAGTWEVGLTSFYTVLPRIQFVRHQNFTFVRPPETLIIHPQDHETTPECPVMPDYIVQDELALDIAVELVQPGEVIGVDGMIEFTDVDEWANVLLQQDGMTLTCASPDSGLEPGTEYRADNVIVIFGTDVTVSHLIIDGSQADYTAVYSPGNDQVHPTPVRSTIAHNDITCGSRWCAQLMGNSNALIADNTMRSLGSYGALNVSAFGPFDENGDQPGHIDGTSVLNNTIQALGPATGPSYPGGIRVRGGRGIVVSGNEVHGAFPNSISVANLKDAVMENNTGLGAQRFAFKIDGARESYPSWDVTVRNNRFGEAGMGGAYVDYTCRSSFTGNDLTGNPGDAGLIFDPNTGANFYIGDLGLVTDNGNLDCDGDGVVDPNVLWAPTPEEGIESLEGAVAALHVAGVLSNGETNSLTSKLSAALKQVAAGKTGPAINQLSAFINQVAAMVNSGRLTGDDAQALTDAAQSVIDQLNAG